MICYGNEFLAVIFCLVTQDYRVLDTLPSFSATSVRENSREKNRGKCYAHDFPHPSRWFIFNRPDDQPASVQTAGGSAAADALVMGELVNVTQSDVTSAYMRTTSSDRYVYAVWNEGGRLVFRRKPVDGLNFERWVNLSPKPLECYSALPDIAAAGSYVYIAWEERCGATNKAEIFLAISKNYGESFGPLVNVTVTQYKVEYAPRLAASGAYLYLFWSSYDDGLHLARSQDYGQTLIYKALGFANDDCESKTLDIKTSGSKVYLLYYDRSLRVEGGKTKTLNFVRYYRGSYQPSGEYSDRQITFEGDSSVRAEGYARLAISGSNVYAAYQIKLYNDTTKTFDRDRKSVV